MPRSHALGVARASQHEDEREFAVAPPAHLQTDSQRSPRARPTPSPYSTTRHPWPRGRPRHATALIRCLPSRSPPGRRDGRACSPVPCTLAATRVVLALPLLSSTPAACRSTTHPVSRPKPLPRKHCYALRVYTRAALAPHSRRIRAASVGGTTAAQHQARAPTPEIVRPYTSELP